MARILDERDSEKIRKEMQAKDNLFEQKLEVLDRDVEELTIDTDNKIVSLDAKVAYNLSELEQDMTAQISTLEQNVTGRVDTLEVNMTNQISTVEQTLSEDIDTLAQNTSTQIGSLEESVSDQLATLEQNTNAKIEGLETSVTTQFDDFEQDVDTQISTLSQSVTTQINSLDENITAQIDDLENTKVDKDGDKVLSENDLTDELKDNYDSSYEHSQQAHAPSDAEMNVQANWTEEDSSSDSYIQNKPTLGTMAAKSVVEKSDLAEDVQASLELANTSLQSYEETDPTVPEWAKQAEKPIYTASEVGALPDNITALKNPNSIIFTGASNEAYDGSSEVTVNIPALPTISEADEGKILCVVNGAFVLVNIADLLPNTEEEQLS